MSDDFQDEIAFLGIEASPSFVRQPESNGVAERFIPLKERQPNGRDNVHPPAQAQAQLFGTSRSFIHK